MEQQINNQYEKCKCAPGLEETYVNIAAAAKQLHEFMNRRGREELEGKYTLTLEKVDDELQQQRKP